ncbi:5-formyltetrahydrofolate cyclo-ligase [Xiamenia xianingshaonis]|nr:5-formyltetrahydrofolate cyclo-ligase [Xiamenia xianingshaonis]
MDAKATTRKRALAARDAIPATDRAARSQALCKRLANQVLRGAAHGSALTVAVYAAMRSEVDLDAFVRALYAANARACFPAMVPDLQQGASKRSVMAFFSVPEGRYATARAAVLRHPLRVFDPATLAQLGLAPVEPSAFDAVAVPLVAFDDANRRLGYGGGNYDRFLPRLRKDCQVIGVAFREQQVPRVPCEPHDLPLDAVMVG